MKKLPRPSVALVVASLALVVSGTGVTAAATGNLVLGVPNQASTTTALTTTNDFTGPTLKLANTGGGPAAHFATDAGKAPFTVKGTTKVVRLNADLLDGRNASSFLRNDSTPQTAVVQGADQLSQSASSLILAHNAVLYDPSGMSRAEPDRLYGNLTGSYVISATVQWTANSTGYRNTTLLDKNGLDFASAIGPPTGGVAITRQNVVGILHLQADDFVQVQVLQGSGGPLNVRLVRLEMTYVGA